MRSRFMWHTFGLVYSAARPVALKEIADDCKASLHGSRSTLRSLLPPTALGPALQARPLR